MSLFEQLLKEYGVCAERFVKFKISIKADAEDVLQEVYTLAYQNFEQLKNKESFKFWLLSIARNKCNDYFRKQAVRLEVPIEALEEKQFTDSRYGVAEVSVVQETLEKLGDKDRQILYLYFWKELPQTEIAKRLEIPMGTVKSRLHTAKQNFKKQYPDHIEEEKGEKNMKRLPEYLPAYTIKESKEAPFPVKWEELMGWFLVPKLGEELSWGMYDIPSRKCSHIWHRPYRSAIPCSRLSCKEYPTDGCHFRILRSCRARHGVERGADVPLPRPRVSRSVRPRWHSRHTAR